MSSVRPAPPFFFVRHGETDWNCEGRLQGQRDVALNARGRDQASAAGRRLRRLFERRNLKSSSLFYVSSPLGRTRATMERLRAALDLPPFAYVTDDLLKELSFGAWEGHTWGELKMSDRESVRTRRSRKWDFVPPGGESYAMLETRLESWVESLRPHAVVVAHGGVARVLMRMLAGCSEADAPEIEVHQGRVLTFEDGRYQWD